MSDRILKYGATMDFTKRRQFLKGAGMAAAGAMAGSALPLDRWSRYGFISTASAQGLPLEGKEGLTVLGDRPLTAETPAHLLDDEVTPVA
ncbi:MAG: twin-arginine translocation signal domain-containing protein, partial [Gammaproteobacteria bacterium]|nr:twin-arginine translocation signal domain-containing protein [Gammaproteobacteria bacterium]